MNGLLQGIVEDPHADDRWLVLADWLEEHDDSRRAELLRLHRRLLATCCEPDRHPERVGWHARLVALLAEGVRPCVPQKTVPLGRGVAMTFSWIPPGTFLMGSPVNVYAVTDTKAAPQRVTLTRGFYLGVYPVTQAQWRAGMDTNPSQFPADDRPVETVSWDDCAAFCRAVGDRTGARLRLPREAEWEYACRAGTTTAYHTGDGPAAMKRAGWCSYDGPAGCANGTAPVGQFQANAWGLYDVHGNVWEWCDDVVGLEFDCPTLNHLFSRRALRGGCWYAVSADCRSACRTGWEESRAGPGEFGCRLCLCPD